MIGRKPLGAVFTLLVVAALVAPDGPAAPTVASTSAVGGVRLAAATFPAACRAPAHRGFWPTRAKVQRVQKRVPVLAVGRNRYGVPNTPPLTSLGKRSFGWDKQGPKPGSHHGNVRFNAHTYPDGSALGNRMLAGLWVGQLIVVKNNYGKTICYRVTRRRTVRPSSYTALVAYYRTDGPPKLAIAVCSGTRLGPGNWTRRTIWFAKPATY
jgi:hypothetical protein